MRSLFSAFLFALLSHACLAQAPPPNSGSTPEYASELEAKLQSNPEDLNSRTELLRFYSLTKSPENYTRHVIWFIENHPDYPAVASDGQILPQGGPLNTQGEYEQARAAWETQLAKPHDSAATLLNAANFLGADDRSVPWGFSKKPAN